jgi:hypothetical protein
MLTLVLVFPVFISVTRTLNQRGSPDDRVSGRRGLFSDSFKAVSSLAPSSAVILPSRIMFRILILSSADGMLGSPYLFNLSLKVTCVAH